MKKHNGVLRQGWLLLLVIAVLMTGCKSVEEGMDLSAVNDSALIDELEESAVEVDSVEAVNLEEAVNNGEDTRDEDIQETEERTIMEGVTNNRVRLRVGPGTDYETVTVPYSHRFEGLDDMDFLLRGQCVEILEEEINDLNEVWYEVSFGIEEGNLLQGWIIGNFLEDWDDGLSEIYESSFANDVTRLQILEVMEQEGVDMSHDLLALWDSMDEQYQMLVMGDMSYVPGEVTVSHVYLLEKGDSLSVIRSVEGLHYFWDQDATFMMFDGPNGELDGSCRIISHVYGMEAYQVQEDFEAVGMSYRLKSTDYRIGDLKSSNEETVMSYLLGSLLLEEGKVDQSLMREELEQLIPSYEEELLYRDYDWKGLITLPMLAELVNGSDGVLRLTTEEDANYAYYYADRVTLEKYQDGGYKPIGCFSLSFPGSIKDIKRQVELAEDNAIISEDGKTVTVHNADELIYHMASDTHFLLMPGDYDLNNADQGLNLASYKYEFYGVNNVVLEGVGEEQLSILTKDWYANTLSFYDSSNITLKNLNIGHSPSVTYEFCAGGVLLLDGVNDIRIEDATLFGCGTVGIIASDTRGIYGDQLLITDCSRNIVEFDGVSDVTFDQCVFENGRNQALALVDTYEMEMTACEFTGIVADYPQITIENEVKLDIPNDGQTYTEDLSLPFQIELINCSFAGQMVETLLKEKTDLADIEIRSGIQEMSGEEAIYMTLFYDEYLAPSDYLSEIDKAKEIVVDAVGDSYLFFINLNLVGEEDEDEIITLWGGELSFPVSDDMSEVMNDGRAYMTVDQGAMRLLEQLPATKTVSGQVSIDETAYLEHAQNLLMDGQVYYGYSLVDGEIESQYDDYIYINALSGEPYMKHYGMYPLKSVPNELGERIIDLYSEYGIDVPKDGRYKAIGFSSMVVVYCDFTWTYWLYWQEENGAYNVNFYEGD